MARFATLTAAVATICTIVALVLDLQQWAAGASVGPTSAWWRFVRTVVAVAPVVPLITAPALGDRLLATALLLSVAADWFLIVRADLMTGIGVFAVVQAVLIWRHLHGASFRRYLDRPLWDAVMLGTAVVLFGNVALWAALSARGLAWPVLAYSVLLVTAVVSAYGSRQCGSLPLPASRYAFWGMLLFALCDITVGIGAAYGGTPAGGFVRALTGVFYTPALILLVRSGDRGPLVPSQANEA